MPARCVIGHGQMSLGSVMERRLKDDVGSTLYNDILGEADIDRPLAIELPAQTQTEHRCRLSNSVERAV